MKDDYLWDRSGAPDPEVARLEQLLGRFGYDARQTIKGRGSWKVVARRWWAAAALIVLAITLWWSTWAHKSSWDASVIAGSARFGAKSIASGSSLAVGKWLTTGPESKVRIKSDGIGYVDVGADSRIRVKNELKNEHRFELAKGKIEAFIFAPPRLFLVETPAALAVDLGCIYQLEVDESGNGLLRVTSGWVELQLQGRVSLVPSGAQCAVRPNVGLSAPLFEDATPRFRDALESIDANDDDLLALGTLLSESRVRDTLTLWHLIQRVTDATKRRRICERISELVPLPEAVELPDALRLDKETLELWREELEDHWWGKE